jgi:hypothetical protein
MADDGLITGEDGITRCAWAGSSADYLDYHDNEWGHPVADDTRLFEKICLEGFQSGLSWITILRKRENFRKAFAGFDIPTVVKFGDDKIEELVQTLASFVTVGRSNLSSTMLIEHWNYKKSLVHWLNIFGPKSLMKVNVQKFAILKL